MPFQPQALDERTLKAFVDRLIQSLRQHDAPLKRAAAQESVARMLGFANWHAAITAVTQNRSKPQESAVSAPGMGLYPAEPLRFTPEHAQAFLLWAFEIGASDVVVTTGDPIYVEAYGRRSLVTRREMTAEEEQAFSQAAGAADPAIASRFHFQDGQQEQEWATTLRGAGHTFRTRVSRCPVFDDRQRKTVLSLRLMPMLPPDLHTIIQDKKLREQMVQIKQGMILVGGGSAQGKTTLIAALTKELMDQPLKKIITFDAPIEFDCSTTKPMEGTKITQHDVTHDPDWPRLTFLRALKRQPSTIIIGQARDQETCEESVRAAMTGHQVIMGQHSETVPDALTKSLRGYGENWKSRAVDLLSSVRIVVIQRLVPTTQGTRVALQEWLEMTDQALDSSLALLKDAKDPIHFRGLLEGVLDQHGHSFEQHAQLLFERGVISVKTRDEYARFQAARRTEKDWLFGR